MTKNWSVEMTAEATKKLRSDFKSGKVTIDDVKVIKRWIADVEELGLEYSQNKPDLRDHVLDGEWKGQKDYCKSGSSHSEP